MDWFDYGARFYDAQIGRFTTQDAFAEKYASMTPYQYGANNPIYYIDINGDSLNAKQTDAQKMVMNTLTKKDAKFVQFDKSGNINVDLLKAHSSESGNYNALLDIASSEIWTNVILDDKNTYKDNESNIHYDNGMSYQGPDRDFVDQDGSTIGGTTTGESGVMGLTLLPGKGKSGRNSLDNSISVIINKNLSEAGRAETYSHEANGHAYIYVTTGGDRARASHNVTTGWKERNKELGTRIIDSKKQTIINMRNR